ncbi:hypothetical protein Mterra_02193 [Calidithermus terrae]|uniref:Uncharacterized protein n=1 Tax=Calidithermus terrae TaxID=1408545 RepID=A0A399EK61_9DEIN|nr:hypothetical protein Mterra_02193 [Calidithermus terrae]
MLVALFLISLGATAAVNASATPDNGCGTTVHDCPYTQM